jgi:hypothetical protein
MLEFKRNQVEEAISRVFQPNLQEPSSELRTRIKRLLETDRALGRSTRSSNPETANYAFFSADAPGSGVEVWFSGYEAFALLNGLRLMGHGWPQGFVVSVLRRARIDLEKEHVRILKRDKKTLFDQDLIRRNARAGDMALTNTDPVFLTIVSGQPSNDQMQQFECSVHRSPASAANWAQKVSGGTGAYTMFEVVGMAHALADKLNDTEPRSRGRG